MAEFTPYNLGKTVTLKSNISELNKMIEDLIVLVDKINNFELKIDEVVEEQSEHE